MASLLFNGIAKTALYVHIPKTGGTSVIDFFRNYNCDIFLHNEAARLSQLLRCPIQHWDYKQLESAYNIDAFDFSFVIVRNPLYKAFSNYIWAQKEQDWPNFDFFVDKLIIRYERYGDYYFHNHWKPQNKFVGEKINKIYRYEDKLENIMVDVLKNVGIEITVEEAASKLKRLNSMQEITGDLDRLVNLDILEKTKQKIYDFYNEDYKLFGYKME